MVHNGGERIVGSSILKNTLIPVLEIGLIRNAGKKGIPFVLGSDETWAVWAKRSGGRISGSKRIRRPRQLLLGWVERGGRVSSICLSGEIVRNWPVKHEATPNVQ